MEPDQHRLAAADLSLEQRKMFAAIDNIFEDHRAQNAAVDWKRLLGNALNQDFICEAIGNEILDKADRDRVRRRELAKFREPRRLAVIAEHRAQCRGWTHPGRAHEIDGAFGASYS